MTEQNEEQKKREAYAKRLSDGTGVSLSEARMAVDVGMHAAQRGMDAALDTIKAAMPNGMAFNHAMMVALDAITNGAAAAQDGILSAMAADMARKPPEELFAQLEKLLGMTSSDIMVDPAEDCDCTAHEVAKKLAPLGFDVYIRDGNLCVGMCGREPTKQDMDAAQAILAQYSHMFETTVLHEAKPATVN